MAVLESKIQTKSQLSELALDAAIALDSIERHAVHADVAIVEKFFREVSSQVSDETNATVFRDGTLYPVYSYALSKTDDQAFERSDEFRQRFLSTIAEFRNMKQDASAVENLKRFCLAVHEALLNDLTGRRVSATRKDERIR